MPGRMHLAGWLLVLSTTAALAQQTGTYFLLVRSWSPTFCGYERSADPDACAAASERFTIHGLWLTCSNGGWPQESQCPGGDWDADGVAALQPQLQQQWPSYGDKGNEAFWEHEWECHGVCAGVENAQLTTEPNFFSAVLGLDTQFPLDGVASQLGLDSPLELSDVKASVAATLGGAVPTITCHRSSGQAYLDSVYICLSDNLQPISCPHSYEDCKSRTLTLPSLQSQQAQHSRSLQAQPAAEAQLRQGKVKAGACSRSPVQCTP